MIKFAFVKENGEVAATCSPSEDGMFTDGEVIDGQTVRSFDYGIDDFEVVTNWYWRDGGWIKTKPAQPSINHYWENYSWVLDSASLMAELRMERDRKLGDSDWRVMPDSPMNDKQKAEWATYRQELRDIPGVYSSITSLDDVTWPTEPS